MSVDKKRLEKLIQDRPFDTMIDILYDYFLQEIIALRMEPESTINITLLANDLGMSRSPIQSALARLREDGLVEKIPGKALRVTGFHASEYSRILQFRRAVEGEAAYHAAKRITKEELQTLKLLLQQSVKKEKDYNEIGRIDDTFHRIIVTSARNSYFSKAYNSYSNNLLRYRYYVSSQNLRNERFIELHSGLYNALKNRFSDQSRKELLYVVDEMKNMFRFFK